MPKTASKRNQAYASKNYLTGTNTETYGRSSKGNARKDSRLAPARNVVGDQGVDYLEQKGSGVAVPSMEQMTPTERKTKAAKLKKTVSDDMDEAIEMVRKKKSASSNDYNR